MAHFVPMLESSWRTLFLCWSPHGALCSYVGFYMAHFVPMVYQENLHSITCHVLWANGIFDLVIHYGLDFTMNLSWQKKIDDTYMEIILGALGTYVSKAHFVPMLESRWRTLYQCFGSTFLNQYYLDTQANDSYQVALDVYTCFINLSSSVNKICKNRCWTGLSKFPRFKEFLRRRISLFLGTGKKIYIGVKGTIFVLLTGNVL